MKIKQIGACLGAAIGATALPAGAAETFRAADDWKFEITPYAWAAGVSGEATVGLGGADNRTFEFERKFSDLVEAVDIALSGLTVIQHDRWVYWVQADYFSLSTDNLESPTERATLDADMFMITAAGGYQFENPFSESNTIDALIGVRYATLKNQVTVNAGPNAGYVRENSADIVDPTILIRPSMYLFKNSLNKKLRFNPTMGIGGGGDSDLVYELQPQFQYEFTNAAVRFGYRTLHYKVEGNRGNEFDGEFSGLFLGACFLI